MSLWLDTAEAKPAKIKLIEYIDRPVRIIPDKGLSDARKQILLTTVNFNDKTRGRMPIKPQQNRKH